MTSMTVPSELRHIVIGVDTHKDVHVAHAKDRLGRAIGDYQMPTTRVGFDAFLAWAHGLGHLDVVGIEGPGHYGAGLARYLREHAVPVREVGRPSRQGRARHGKSDPADAAAAASAVLAGDELGDPKSADGNVEMLRILRAARISAVRARTAAINALQDLVVAAPQQLRDDLAGLSGLRLVRTCAAIEAPRIPSTPAEATVTALSSLAHRYQALADEAAALQTQIARLVAQACPALLALYGIGPDSAATLLVALGDNPQRLSGEAAFARLCGVAPVEASSGKTVRHRLNRGGNRDANRALHTTVVVRLRRHDPTRAYLARRTTEGKTKKEIIRCLKRYVAREVYNVVVPPERRALTA